MSERLIIRLASEANKKNHWLVWSDSENEIIASGEVDNAEQLALLQSQSEQRLVVCLLPGVDVLVKPVVITGTFNRQMQKALPYLLEDEFAGDVDDLHFSVFEKQKDLVHVAVCNKDKMNMWLSWLDEAQIVCRQFIPETLALKTAENDDWQAVKIDEQWLIRENKNMGWACDAQMLPFILNQKLEAHRDEQNVNAEGETADDNETEKTKINIVSFTESNESIVGNWSCPRPSLAMEVLATGTIDNKINLLSGEFKRKKEMNPQFALWRNAAIALVVLFVLSLFNIYMQSVKTAEETNHVQAQVEDIYQQAFPNSSQLKYPRIKKKIKTLMKASEQSSQVGFIDFIQEVAPYFNKNSEMKIESVKFKSSKGELNILAVGKNFNSFEAFAEKLPKKFILEQGALNNRSGSVTGLLIIRMK